MINLKNVSLGFACLAILSVLPGTPASVQTVDDELIQTEKQQAR